jgi:hypothetical protein
MLGLYIYRGIRGYTEWYIEIKQTTNRRHMNLIEEYNKIVARGEVDYTFANRTVEPFLAQMVDPLGNWEAVGHLCEPGVDMILDGIHNYEMKCDFGTKPDPRHDRKSGIRMLSESLYIEENKAGGEESGILAALRKKSRYVQMHVPAMTAFEFDPEKLVQNISSLRRIHSKITGTSGYLLPVLKNTTNFDIITDLAQYGCTKIVRLRPDGTLERIKIR